MNPVRPSRRGFLVGSAAAAWRASAQPPKRANILFLLTDDQRWDALGCMGNRIIQTPVIDRLASEGVRLPAAMRGTRRREMTLNVDVAPTILSITGIPQSSFMQGRNLSPLTRGESPSWRNEFYYSHLFVHQSIPKNEGIRTERWKYIRYIESEPL